MIDARGGQGELLQDVIAASAVTFGDKVFVRTNKAELSFAQLEELTAAIAASLRHYPPRSNIGLMLNNSIEYLLCYLGTIRAGHVAVPLNPELKGRALQEIVDDCRIALFFANERARVALAGAGADTKFDLVRYTYDPCGSLPEELDPDVSVEDGWPSASEDDVASIIHTSGTSGRPKGVCLTHRNLLSNAEGILDRIAIDEHDDMLVILPFYYSYGNSLILTHLLRGATLTLNRSSLFPNQILDDLSSCNSLAGVASHFIMLLKRSNIRKRDLSSLAYVTFAGEPVPDWVVKEMLEIVPHLRAYVMYGQTEATARISILSPEEFPDKPGSVGRPIRDLAVTVVDERGDPLPPRSPGEIVVSGPSVMKGYWSDGRAEVPSDARLLTGDHGWLDDDGYLYIHGRTDDMMKVGGERVFPLEIEEILLALPQIAEAGIIGHRGDAGRESLGDYLGMELVACVVTSQEISERDIIAHCRDQLPPYKVPKKVCYVDGLPRTPNGKLKRDLLCDWYRKAEAM